MHILLTNDDGFASPGLNALKLAVHNAGHDVWVVAPDSNRSGMSHSITLHEPFRVQKLKRQEFQAGGSPADCVRVALAGLMTVRPDIVLSGINHGPNLGTDITYSGTAAAARQAAYMNVPALALSIWDDGRPFDFLPLADIIVRKLEQFVDLWTPEHFININGPNHPTDKIAITYPTLRIFQEKPYRLDLPNGDQYWYIDGKSVPQDRDPGSDLAAVQDGYISISPIHLQPTQDGAARRYEEINFTG